MRIYCILLIVLLSLHLQLHAEENADLKDYYIRFSHTHLTVREALNELRQVPGISVVFNGDDSFLSQQLVVPVEKITVKAALDIISDQAPIDILVKNKYIIVKSRKLESQYILEGSITSSGTGHPLVAADILIINNQKGTVSDINGKFVLSLKPGNYQLLIKYLGYKDELINISLYQDQNIQVSLNTQHSKIAEVNVRGKMGEMEGLETGRPIEKIEARTINQLNTNDVNDAIHGRINGVWATKVSGAPGDHVRIRIRGISSILGSTDPLYVVDGMLIPIVNFKSLGISDLNTSDIQSITVLKDASSTALYGYLGGNGVVIIETRKGGNETQFNLRLKKGIQSFNKRYPLMNTENFLSSIAYSDTLLHTGYYTAIPALGRYEKYPYYRDSLGIALGSEDFQDEVFQTGHIDEIALSGKGSFKNIDYYISGNYYAHQGVVVSSGYEKYTFTGNFSRIFSRKLSARLLLKSSWQENKNNLDEYMGNNIIYKGINYEPGYRFTPDSFFTKNERMHININDYQNQITLNQLAGDAYSPEQLFYTQIKKRNDLSHSGHGEIIYNLSDLFSIRATYSAAIKKFRYSSKIPGHHGQIRKYLFSNEQVRILSQQYDLRYKKSNRYHNISALLRYRNYKDNVTWLVDSMQQVRYDQLSVEDNIYIRGSQSIYGVEGSVIRRINSGIGNINYNYKTKYFISGIANLSHLNEGFSVNNSTLFTSIALNWNLAKEEWLSAPAWLDAFHLSANWGHSGNYPLNSLSNDLFLESNNYTSGDSVSRGIFIDNLANHHIRHEKITEFNYGASISLLSERLVLSGDYFFKKNNDLLLQRAIPYYFGGGYFYQNIGEMQNRGLELALMTIPINRASFEWASDIGFATNKQVIKRLYGGEPINFNRDDILFPDFYIEENAPLGNITGYSFQGIWIDSLHSESMYGYPKYVENRGAAYLNADTTDQIRFNRFSKTDMVVIGNSIPKFTCNWINNIRYKNFSCEMLWYAVIGVDKYNATKASTYIKGTNRAVQHLVMDTLSYYREAAFYQSSFFVEDASFIRMKTLSFRYNHPLKISSKMSIEYSISFENLITLTRYTGFDPEATIYTNNNFTDNAIDNGSYPNPRAFFCSINLSF